MIKMIVAIDNNGLIGSDDKLPWHFRKDMDFFKNITLNQTVVMGRETYLTLPENFRPLPKRRNVILTRKGIEDNRVEQYNDFNSLISKEGSFFVIGGGTLYSLFFNICEEIYITKIKGDFEGNVFFKEAPLLLDSSVWKEELIEEVQDIYNGKEYSLSFYCYKRKF